LHKEQPNGDKDGAEVQTKVTRPGLKSIGMEGERSFGFKVVHCLSDFTFLLNRSIRFHL